MVVIRMQRMGRAHRPFYRIGVMDKRSPRNGRVIENLGWYDPVHTMGKDQPEFKINEDRTRYWLSVGATATRAGSPPGIDRRQAGNQPPRPRRGRGSLRGVIFSPSFEPVCRSRRQR